MISASDISYELTKYVQSFTEFSDLPSPKVEVVTVQVKLYINLEKLKWFLWSLIQNKIYSRAGIFIFCIFCNFSWNEVILFCIFYFFIFPPRLYFIPAKITKNAKKNKIPALLYILFCIKLHKNYFSFFNLIFNFTCTVTTSTSGEG